ncbi:tRNA preQ1(34) S-adenosylmethionine ribosyltransferase-isomerase QueA [Amaricoccus macauensis]|uniref:tRNA preQ1(34) S-adenosylmethionine ribosyltransferase-isomerase QueA n=1 Tax=Amaricoccus macauensis TaxID=57001 RepID=UPI003C7980DD
MQLDDFDFSLPEDLIALRPLRPRPASRLLVADDSSITDSRVSQIGDHLVEGDLLVLNDTRVIPGRLHGVRERPGGTGARVEVTLISARPDGGWHALAKPGKRLAPGDTIRFGDRLSATVQDREGAEVSLFFSSAGAEFEAALEALGEMPLPPYIAGRRAVDAQDRTDYQTVFARNPGAVAAPTASLHFDEALLSELAGKGIRFAHVTLHVGAGTFLPVKTDRIEDHKMHKEWGEIGPDACEAIHATLASGRRVIPVGTTALRVLETAATGPSEIRPWHGETDIFIRPGHEFRVTRGLMTNFHLPKSTLMMLVSALMGTERIRDIYAHAIEQRYRFFSYGDSSLLLPKAA